MRSLLFPVICGCVGLAAACGSGFTAGGSGGSGTTTMGASSSSGTATSSSSGSTGTGGTTTTSPSTTTTVTASTTTTTTVTNVCPDETGTYMATSMGAGCGDLALDVPQCIKAGNLPCQYNIVYQMG